MGDLDSPEGIERRHIHEVGGTRLQSSPFALVALGAVLAASVLGVFGSEARITGESEGVTLDVQAPIRIRGGEFYEMIFIVETERDISDLVLLVEPDAWRDVTVNTFIPAPSEEDIQDGSFAFSFGPMAAGQRLEVKVDAQVNPDHAPSANEAAITVADGEDALTTIEYRMEVLP